MSNVVLELKNITKIFPGVKALDNVNFKVREGEIHALMGENVPAKAHSLKSLRVFTSRMPAPFMSTEKKYRLAIREMHSISGST